MGGVRGIVSNGGGEAGDRVERPIERDEQHAQHLLGAGIGGIQDHRLGRVVRGTRDVADIDPHRRAGICAGRHGRA